MKRTLCAFTAFICFAAAALAIPAKPKPVTLTQPDGTELTLTICGDEHRHYFLSEDGFLVLNVADSYYYGNLNEYGEVEPSTVLARPVSKRLDADREFLSKVNMPEIMEAMQKTSDTSNKKRTPGIGLFTPDPFPAIGRQKGVAILVQYTDVKFTVENPNDYFHRMLNEKGFSDNGSTGSAYDYFVASSYGQFKPQFDVYGPVTLSQNQKYYGGNDSYGDDKNPHKMVIEACEQLNDSVDFSQYDLNDDGYVDMIYIIYAGRGEADGGGANTVWPHSYVISGYDSTNKYIYDEKTVDAYACSNEWCVSSSYTGPTGIGSFVHEFSHVLGLPDLYDTSGGTCFTPGAWSVLDVGPYNNEGRTPPLYGAFERNALGWLNPTPITDGMDAELLPISNNVAYVIDTNSKNEFFLLENRQQEGFDKYIPGHGMLIWHILYSATRYYQNTVNTSSSKQYVDIEEADNKRNDYTVPGDAFPGKSNVTEFTNETNPSMKTWGGTVLNLPITEIAESDSGIITFKVGEGGEYKPAGNLDAVPFAESKVDAIAPTDVKSFSFAANWDALPEATGYRITLLEGIEENEADSTIWRVGKVIEEKEVGSIESQKFYSLTDSTLYAYYVVALKAIDADSVAESLPSDTIFVRTTAWDGIEEPEVPESGINSVIAEKSLTITRDAIIATKPVSVYAIDGRVIYTNRTGRLVLAPGFYILSDGSHILIK